jgi:hypothetical protein
MMSCLKSRWEILGPTREVNGSGKDGDAGGETGEGENWEKN